MSAPETDSARPWRIVFMGTPDFAAPTLAALLMGPDPVVGVFTQPDRRVGRGMKVKPPPIKTLAEARGVPVFQPRRLRDPEALADFRALEPDLAVVAAYGQILSQEALETPRFGCINVHASLLPRWRGAAPIQRALMAGDEKTGVAIMRMEAGLDSGPILAMREQPISPTATAGSLHDCLSRLGAGLLRDTLAELKAGRIVPRVQPEEGVTLAPKIERADELIDWARPAEEIARRIRALAPQPGARAAFDGKGIKVYASRAPCGACQADGAPGEVTALHADGPEVACGDGSLVLTELQSAGRRRMAADQWLRGHGVEVSAQFGPGTL